MVAKIESLHWFPLKGGKEWKMHELEVNTKVGVAVDGLIVLNNAAAKSAATDAAKH